METYELKQNLNDNFKSLSSNLKDSLTDKNSYVINKTLFHQIQEKFLNNLLLLESLGQDWGSFCE